MVANCGSDAEGLLHKPIWFVAIAIRTICRISVSVGHLAVWMLTWRVETVAASLPFHLAICEEAAGHSAGAPRLSIRPPSHAGFSFIPDKD